MKMKTTKAPSVGCCGSLKNKNNCVSIIAIICAGLRKSVVRCKLHICRGGKEQGLSISAVHHMEIGWPTDVQHMAPVNFDGLNGFDFQFEFPTRVPSLRRGSAFGVSAESLQRSEDSRGNSVPTLLLQMQDKLYSQGGLKAEGIFRINPDIRHEEEVYSQLNKCIVPDYIDVHCLAALIKAFFRELPSGLLDGLSPKQVLECNTKEKTIEIVKQLQPTESALLNWAVDLMADVVEQEGFNKMNAKSIARFFAPNMTKMADPVTSLCHAVQLTNLVETLIIMTLRQREEASTGVTLKLR